MTKHDTDQKNIIHKNKMRNYFLAIICFALIACNTFTNIPIAETEDSHCIVDRSFIHSKDFHQHIKQNPEVRKFLVIISSLLIDYSLLSLIILWVLYDKTWQPLISTLAFYAFRGLCNNLYLLQSPTDLLWEFPGIWSFSVSYHQTTDFFFSGHVGINFISAYEVYRLGFTKTAMISIFGVFCQIFVMINVRGHFFIDLIAGLLSAHYSIILSGFIHKYVSQLVLDLDYEKVLVEYDQKQN